MHHANHWTPEGIQKGLEFLRQAIETDPADARSYAGLGYIYILLGFFGMAAPRDLRPAQPREDLDPGAGPDASEGADSADAASSAEGPPGGPYGRARSENGRLTGPSSVPRPGPAGAPPPAHRRTAGTEAPPARPRAGRRPAAAAHRSAPRRSAYRPGSAPGLLAGPAVGKHVAGGALRAIPSRRGGTRRPRARCSDRPAADQGAGQRGCRAALPPLTRWLGVRSDADAVDEMTHPERSPYAGSGPQGYFFGANDPKFEQDPQLRPPRRAPHSREQPPAWGVDASLTEATARLAERFGY